MNERLELPPEEMRRLGYAVVDLIVDHLAGVGEQPATGKATRSEMEARLREPPPEDGRDLDTLLERLRVDVIPNVMYLDHPRFFGFVPSPSNYVSVLGDAIASAVNPFMGSWLVSSGPSTIELVTMDWLRDWCGLPETAGGLFVSGGSMANLVAIAVARHARLGNDMTDAVAYCSDQTHTSVVRAMRVLGFAEHQLRHVSHLELADAVRDDRVAGRRPFCVIANAGTTNTGAVDPLPEMADLCRSEDLWFHVDGSYGAAAVITDEGRELLAGIDRADSLALDPHKWLFQPYEIGGVLVRDRHLLPETFSIFRDYLRDAIGADDEVNFRDWGVQLTRGFRALKLWLSIQVFGVASFRSAVQHGLDLARHAERVLRVRDGWEIVTPAQLAIVTFRYAPAGLDDAAVDTLNQEMNRRMYEDGYAMMASTEIEGRPVMRMCLINPRTTEADIEGTIRKLEELA